MVYIVKSGPLSWIMLNNRNTSTMKTIGYVVDKINEEMDYITRTTLLLFLYCH